MTVENPEPDTSAVALLAEPPAADDIDSEETTPPPAKRHSAWRTLRELVLGLAVVALVFVGTRSVAQGREVLGPSMQPTFQQGQRIFVAKYVVGSPAHGDVVVFKPPVASQDDFIKRVIGVPGDHVVVRDGVVSVNGQPLDEPYVHGAISACGGQYCDVTLGADEYYVMGDNRPNSSDSRYWGPVKGSNIKGHAWLRYFPFGDFKFAP